VVLDGLDDPQLRGSKQSRRRRSRTPQLAQRHDARLRLDRGFKLEFADDAVRVVKLALDPMALNSEAPTIDGITVKRRFPHREVPDCMLELNRWHVVQSIADKQALAAHLDVASATDILWALNHPNLYMLLAGERGWSPEHYEQWLGDLVCAQLLRDHRATTRD
jgi:hypothetical protein